MSLSNVYKAKELNLSNLKGISDETLEMHFKLYWSSITPRFSLPNRPASPSTRERFS